MSKRIRDWCTNFGPAGLAPGEHRTLTDMVGGCSIFHGEVLVMGGSDEGVLVESIFVGNKRQRPPEGVEAFPFVLEKKHVLRLDPLHGALCISITVTNKGDKAKTFYAAIVGLVEIFDGPEEMLAAWKEI